MTPTFYDPTLTPHPGLPACSTPVGDILNSFAKDQDTLDETLPDTLHMTTIYLMILLTSMSIVIVSIHYYAFFTAALFIVFAIMQVGPAGGGGWGFGVRGGRHGGRVCVCVGGGHCTTTSGTSMLS